MFKKSNFVETLTIYPQQSALYIKQGRYSTVAITMPLSNVYV